MWCHIRHSGILFHRPEYAPLKPIHLDHQNKLRHYPAPIVGENSIGMRLAWRSFQAAIKRSASSSTWASVARRAAASFSAACGADPPSCGG